MMTYKAPVYLDSTSPNAFLDWTKRSPEYGMTKECPCCKGFGGWNLQINAYGLPGGAPNTPENRHKFVHFRTICGHCNGWGYVHPSENCPGHVWKWKENLGRCFNRYECTRCQRTSDVDSGD